MYYCKKMTGFCLRHNIISEKLAPWLTYSLQRICLSTFSYTLLILLGWHIQGFINTIIFLYTFTFLRKYIGGWHAATPLKCLFFSAFCECVFLIGLFPLLMLHPFILSNLIAIGSIISVYIFAPLPPKALHATNAHLDALKRLSRRTILLEFIVMILLLAFNLNAYAICVSLGISCAAFSLWIEKSVQIITKKRGVL